MHQAKLPQNQQVKGDEVPDGIQYEFETNTSNKKMPSGDIEFNQSEDEQNDNKMKIENPSFQLFGPLPMIQEENVVQRQLFGVVLVKEIKNPNNQKLSRKDTAMAFNTIFKLMTQNDAKIQLPILNLREILIEPILSSGVLKGSLIINVDQTMYEVAMAKPHCTQTLYDRIKGIEREFTFNFFDLQKIKEQHLQLQTGRFASEFVQVVTDKTVTGRRTTQIIYAMHIRDGQLYAIKKVRLSALPSWERIYNNQVHEIREIKAMLRLSHKNVLRLFSWWMEDENEEVQKMDGQKKYRKAVFLYLQTEYMAYKDQSSDLLEFIYVNFEYYRMPIHQRRQKIYVIFNQVLDGLDYVHEQGFFHRDIKPENILVTENCWGEILIKICDFDFAKNLSDESNEMNKQSFVQSRMTGTPGYTSFRSGQGQTYDIREEIFMLGMVLLDLCKLYPEATNRKNYHANAQSNKFPEAVLANFSEEILLFKAMAIDSTFTSIRKVRESREWQNFVAKVCH